MKKLTEEDKEVVARRYRNGETAKAIAQDYNMSGKGISYALGVMGVRLHSKTTSPLSRFWKFVNVTSSDGCWEWTGHVTKAGYGGFNVDGKMKLAHRVSYEFFIDDIPSGPEIDHLCKNTKCVHPYHLEAVTPRENVLRSNSVAAINALKTHCLAGHEYTPGNTKYQRWRDRRRGRYCLTCTRARSKARRASEKRG